MVNECVNCGGALKYDIALAKLKCESCDSIFDADSYVSKTDAKEATDFDNIDMTIFTCPNCGAEIASTELDSVEYCMYCGSFVTLKSRSSEVKKPDLILPFSKSIDECKQAYSNMVKKKLYAPKEFRDASFLDGFKGIYIPFWTYKYKYGPLVKISGCDESRHGDYIHKQNYNIECKVDGELDGISYDASAIFDDELSKHLVPFERKKMKKFNPSYMFGFYGDIADVNSSVYHEAAAETARDEIWERVSSNPEVRKGHPIKVDGTKFDSDFSLKKSSALAMLPVWFLTWKKEDRIAYSVVNGDSGQIYSEIPIDPKRYLLISLISAIPVFFLLNMLITFNVNKMLFISLILSIFVLVLYVSQLDGIVRRKMHSDDLGYLSKDQKAKEENKKNVTPGLFSGLGEYFNLSGNTFTFFEMAGLAVILVVAYEYILIAAVLLVVCAPVYIVCRVNKDSKILGDKTVWRDIAGSLVALLLSALLLLLDPAGDEFYYIMAIVCMTGICSTAVSLIKRYNTLITRPIPHFFDRKAGGES